MKKGLALLLVAFVSISAIAQDWMEVVAFQPGQTLQCIRFANDSVGYTVSSLYGGSTYNIHKTTDGGDTWFDQNSGYAATRFKDIWTFSEDTVMMCGNYGLVIHTNNGGETWIADTVSQEGDHLFGISFAGNTGYVCGNSGAIYKTQDMGESWTKIDPPFITAIEEICFLTEELGFICGLNFIYYTLNGGLSWLEPESFPGATTNWWLRQMSFVNDSVGFVCGDIGQIYKTNDAGKNWVYMPTTPTDESLQSMVALDENNLYACGFGGIVMYSTDGAESWHLMTAQSDEHFYSMDFTPEGIGFICSHSGEVLRYIDPSLTVKEKTHAVEFSLYPNPSIDHFYVDFAGDENINGTVIIYDLNGKIFKSLEISGIQSQINIGNLQQGIYIIEINVNQKKVYQRFIKQ